MLREQGYRSLMSVHGVDYYPRSAPRRPLQLLDMARVDRLTVKLRVPLAQPTVASVTPDWQPPTTRSARSTTCSACASTATPTCGGS